jgi:hypothetical protein
LKVVYTAFVAVMVPFYWRSYGPQNFLFFCDVAVLVTLVAIWIESSLLTSMQAVAILVPQGLWVVDFVAHLVGVRLLGMTDYMFDAGYPLYVRALSSFHGWMPLLLVFMLYRLGYDRRALVVQTIVGVGLLLVSYLCFAPPPAPASHPSWAVNMNYVYGPSDKQAQTWMPPLAWLGILIVGFPTLIYLPTHLLLAKVLGRRDEVEGTAVQPLAA